MTKAPSSPVTIILLFILLLSPLVSSLFAPWLIDPWQPLGSNSNEWPLNLGVFTLISNLSVV